MKQEQEMFWKKKLPLPWIQSWEIYLQYSPDALFLQNRPFHRLFVPDEMMFSNREHYHLKDNTIKINLGFLTLDKFSFLGRIEGNYITGIPLRSKVLDFPYAPIRGELYAISPEWLIELDNYKENGVLFKRERVSLRIPFHRQEKKTWDIETKQWIINPVEYSEHVITAWMYLGNLTYWLEIIDKSSVIKVNKNSVSFITEDAVFSPIKTFIPHNPLLEEYYYFTPLEYDALKFKLDTSTPTMPGLRKYRRSG